ncbi:hypothetical protein ASC87_12155 [Rhizobacter sp. Root1221]|nr:hypothetical protein ASC87_12155 [Rhizobacter sp. Root1221]
MWLSQLNASAIGLPEVESDNEDGLPDLPDEPFAKARSNLACFNGWHYREFFDPDPTLEDPPCMGDVGDDLLDTYKDIKSGLLLFERGAVTEALWHWSFLHRVHWGRHAVGAMLALHCLCISRRGVNP